MSLLPDWVPNLHPLVIHFPIVLLCAAVLFDFLGLVLRGSPWLSKAALLLFVLGAVGAIAAVVSGHQAVDGLDKSGLLPHNALHDLHEHTELGKATAWFFGIYAGLRLILTWWGSMKHASFAVIVFLIGFGGLFLLWETAEHGGKMVYYHNLGTRATREQQMDKGQKSVHKNTSLHKKKAATPVSMQAGPKNNR